MIKFFAVFNIFLRMKEKTRLLLFWVYGPHCMLGKNLSNFVLVDKPKRQIWTVFCGRFYAHKPTRIKVLFSFLYVIYDTLYSSFKIILPIQVHLYTCTVDS